MKRSYFLLLCLLFLGLYHQGHGQGNLQFNDVKYIEVQAFNRTYGTSSITYYYILDSVNVTVPAGKVWKVESVGVNAYQNSPASAVQHKFPTQLAYNTIPMLAMINNNIVVRTFATSDEIDRIESPIWLKPGTYSFKVLSQGNTSVLSGSTPPATVGATGYFSVIEFNVVP